MATDSSTRLPAWKRLVDIAAALFALAVLAIPLFVIAVTIVIDDGMPVFFRQRRIGLNHREFVIWKLRTLPIGTPQMAKGDLLQTATPKPRPLGRFLRRWSLDELPNLFNVVTGDMSLIGPRPAYITQSDLIALRIANGALRVRPGLTGLAQVSGREDLSIEQKAALDGEYARRVSPALDLNIALRTAGAVFRERGSY